MPLIPTAIELRIPQVRTLAVLAGEEGVLLSREKLAERAGFSVISGTITRVLNGIRRGSSSGEAHAGLLELGLVERIDLEVEEGLIETSYRITGKGERAYREWIARNGQPGEGRDKKASINKRYQSK